MDCNQFESVVIEYMSGELRHEQAQECRAHLDQCPGCREQFEAYERVVHQICAETPVTPTEAESRALGDALAKSRLPRAAVPQRAFRPVEGFVGFLAASVAVFAIVAVTLALHAFGAINLLELCREIGFPAIAAVAIVVVFVTSFIPIAVTARRRPLNGMTFRQ